MNHRRVSFWRASSALPLLLAALGAGNFAAAASVLMISVDGLKPEYVLDADAHGLKIPFLRSLLRDGAHARGVTGVWPTVTYPSHTTLLTGLSPAEHGIYNNLEFDPKNTFANAWYWYAQQIRVPTLWQAAHEAGLSTASIGWPVSVGARAVDFLIPEYWRVARLTDVDPSDALLITAVARPEGLLQEMQARLGPYMRGNDPSPPGDEIKTRYALDILKTKKPKFMTIHLSSLDEEQHGHGPFSPEADRDLEVIDGQLAQLFAAARDNDPKAVAVVVSDHGFVHITHKVNLMQPFLRAGLVESGGAWKAQPWSGAGMAAVMLHDPADSRTEGQVRELLQTLKADPDNGIAEVLERGAIKQRGAFPDAAFLIIMKLGYYALSDAASPLVSEVQGPLGSHGFSPEYPEMRAAFFIDGPGIAPHRDLGVIDMRRIAPTVAQLLGVRLTRASQAPLDIRQ
ncbi:MAG TPA: ectonucleotide pyrophosphatase/phosphodiesterase [Steroidobacteraceae bacterium]|jgi:predicted AlkP superfamily pyrophosphatase or phosphodiesterase|nr:ectonucleotide pyrophosphatase/phosphodiesterase [Steroidobacteraceae bacterium]